MPVDPLLEARLDEEYEAEQARMQRDTEAARMVGALARRREFAVSTTSPAPAREQGDRMRAETEPSRDLVEYVDPDLVAKSMARKFLEAKPDAPDAALEQFREWAKGRKALIAARMEGRDAAGRTGYDTLPAGWKAAAVGVTALDAGARSLTAGASDVAIEAVAGEKGLRNLREVEAGIRKAVPVTGAIEGAASLAGTIASPVMRGATRGAQALGAGAVPASAVGFGVHSGLGQGAREVTGEFAGGDDFASRAVRLVTATTDGAIKGAALAAVTPRLAAFGERVARLTPGLGRAASQARIRVAAAIEQAAQNAVLEFLPGFNAETGVSFGPDSMSALGTQVLLGALFGGATGNRFSDVFRRELGKAGLSPAEADALAPEIADEVGKTEGLAPDPKVLALVEDAAPKPPPSADPVAATEVLKDAVDKGLVAPEEVVSPERAEEYRQSEYEARRDGATPEQAAEFAAARVETMPAATRPDGTVAGPTVPTEQALAEGMIEGPARPLVEEIVAEGGDTVSSGVGADGRPFAVGVDARGETIVRRGVAGRGEPKGPLPERVATADVKADPARFQFKANTSSETGAGDALADVRTFDPMKADNLLVWEDRSGQQWVADGHHRLDLAKRTGYPEVSAFVLREANGVTAERARGMAALRNIANGKGTALDAAKAIRDLKYTVEDFQRDGISTRSVLVRDALGIAALDDSVLSQVVNGDLPENYAAEIGRQLPGSPAKQRQAAKAVRDAGNMEEAASIVRQVRAAPDVETQQESLFGAEAQVESLYAERAKVEVALRRRLASDRGLFNTLAEKAAKAQSVEGTTINVEGSKGAAQTADELSFVLKTYADRGGAVSGILDTAARSLRDGTPIGEVVTAAVEALGRIDWHTDTAPSADEPRDRGDTSDDLFGGGSPRGEAAAAEPVAPAPPRGVARAKKAPPAPRPVPAGYELVGKTKRGRDVYRQIRDDAEMYVARGVGGRLGPVSPSEIAEARSSRAATPEAPGTVADALRSIHEAPPAESGGTTLTAGFDPVKASSALFDAYHRITDATDRLVKQAVAKVVDPVRRGLARATEVNPETGQAGNLPARLAHRFGVWAGSRFLSREYVAARAEQKGTRALSQHMATKRATDLLEVRGGEKRTDADKRAQYDYFNGDLPRDKAVAALGKDAVDAMDRAIKVTSGNTQRLVDLGILDKSVLEKYPGEGGQAYLRRVYEAVEREAAEAGVAGTPSRTKAPKIRRRQDLTEMERTLLGEIRDVAVLVDHTIRYQGSLLGVHEFQRRMADTVALDKPAEGYWGVPLPKDKRFGPLAGKYLPRQDYFDIYNEGNPGGAFYRAMRTFNGYFRKAHTAYNPGTWTRNAAWNATVSHISGLDAFNPADAKHWANAARVMMAQGETPEAKVREALIEARILGSDFLSSEVLDTQARMAKLEAGETWGDATLRIGKAAVKAPAAFYSAQDNFFKVALYLKATAPKTRGGMEMPHALAVRYVQDMSGLPNFDTGTMARIPRAKSGALELLANPFLRGATTTAEYAARMLAHHPTRTLAAMAGWWGASRAAMSALGLTDDDVKAMNDALPDWQDVSFTTPLLPMRTDDGHLMTLDVTSVIPGAREWKTLASILDGEADPTGGSNLRQVPWGPVVQLVTALALNRDSLTLKPIDRSRDATGPLVSDAEGDRARWRFIGKVLLPDFMPWGGRGWGKLETSFSDLPLDREGRVSRDPTMAVLQALGVGARKLDLDYAVQTRATEIDRILRRKRDGLRQTLAAANVAEDDKARALVEYEEDVGRLVADLTRLVDQSIPRLRRAGLLEVDQK